MELKERIDEVKDSTFDENNKEKKKIESKAIQQKISICRVFAYFIIYSFLGFVIETLFALINFGVLESRKGFLYGPFSPIYGVGAVVMIVFLLQTLFFVTGSN